MAGDVLPASTHMGPVALTVADLARSLDYYTHAIGLAVLDRSGDRAVLGAGTRALLELTEVPGAPPADGHTGLFHFALLLPERAQLAGWLARASSAGVRLTGASDHFVSEALYLRDPDHHGIELYWDRPRETWEGQVDRMGSWPLDVQDLLASAAPLDAMPDGTVMGHVHLRVADIADTERFYRDELGFDVTAHLGDQATFLSAGGYHHHLGGNVWESRGAGPAPEGSATLRWFTIVAPGAEERELADPAGNRLRIVSA